MADCKIFISIFCFFFIFYFRLIDFSFRFSSIADFLASMIFRYCWYWFHCFLSFFAFSLLYLIDIYYYCFDFFFIFADAMRFSDYSLSFFWDLADWDADFPDFRFAWDFFSIFYFRLFSFRSSADWFSIDG